MVLISPFMLLMVLLQLLRAEPCSNQKWLIALIMMTTITKIVILAVDAACYQPCYFKLNSLKLPPLKTAVLSAV